MIFIFCSAALQAATFELKAIPNSEKWDDPNNWNITGIDNDGIPDSDDDVMILGGKTINIIGIAAKARTILLKGNLIVADGSLIVSPGNGTEDAINMADGTTLEIQASGELQIQNANNGIVLDAEGAKTTLSGTVLIESLVGDGISLNDDDAFLIIEGNVMIQDVDMGITSTGAVEVAPNGTLNIKNIGTGLNMNASVGIGARFTNQGSIIIEDTDNNAIITRKLFVNTVTGSITVKGDIDGWAIDISDNNTNTSIDAKFTNTGRLDIREFSGIGISCQACTLDNTGTINVEAPASIDVSPFQRGLICGGQSTFTNESCGVIHMKVSMVYNAFSSSTFHNYGFLIIDAETDSDVSSTGFVNYAIIADVVGTMYLDILGAPNDFGLILYPPASEQIYVGSGILLGVAIGSQSVNTFLGGIAKNEVFLDANCTVSAGTLGFGGGFFAWEPNSNAACNSDFYVRARGGNCAGIIPFRTLNATPVYNGTSTNLNIKAYLQGAYNTSSDAMNDGLRTLIDPNAADPYLGIVSPTVSAFNERGTNSVVDWVLVELRRINGGEIYQFPCLVQRDGDIVDRNGVSTPDFNIPRCEEYNIVVKHRNHLGVMTATPVFVE